MRRSVFTRIILAGILFSPVLLSANLSNSTSIAISVVVPERLENSHCNIGFQTSNNSDYQSLKATGCKYSSQLLIDSASQLAQQKDASLNSQGFVTVVITAP